MTKRTIKQIIDSLCKELDEYADKGILSMGDLETVSKLSGTIKNLKKIEKMEGGMTAQEEFENSPDYPYVRDGGKRRHGKLTDKLQQMLDEEDIEPAERKALERALEQMR